ncbi:MAG: hypothetical protein K2J79_11855 [Ruminiclostridium sp.]|nr:hypothetical protein [Ruminiclostridium sp.]
MSDVITQAAQGDINAFAEAYKGIYKKMYCGAYYTLATENEAVESVKIAADKTFAEMSACKNQKDFETLFLKKLSEQIIKCYREYRKNPPDNSADVSYIKGLMRRLTDAERLAVTFNVLFDISPKEISKVTGLAEDVVAKKLESGRNKLALKL